MTRSFFVFLTTALLLFACNKDETPRPRVEITSFALQGVGEFDFQEDVVLLLESQGDYSLSVSTDPGQAKLWYAINQGVYSPMKVPVVINGGTRKISFIAENEAHRPSIAREILISYSPGQYLGDIQLSGITTDSLSLSMANESRGELQLTIINLWGQQLYKNVLLKKAHDFNFNLNVSGFEAGMYIVYLQMGGEKKVYKFIKK